MKTIFILIMLIFVSQSCANKSGGSTSDTGESITRDETINSIEEGLYYNFDGKFHRYFEIYADGTYIYHEAYESIYGGKNLLTQKGNYYVFKGFLSLGATEQYSNWCQADLFLHYELTNAPESDDFKYMFSYANAVFLEFKQLYSSTDDFSETYVQELWTSQGYEYGCN